MGSGTPTMTFPSEIASVIGNIASGSLSLLETVVVSYWPWIIGLGVLLSLGYKFRRIFGLAK